ncbi:MAG TPA: hypothetical protein VIR57_16110 [Chloroflexota bacterium]|jgi:hypothetical protein
MYLGLPNRANLTSRIRFGLILPLAAVLSTGSSLASAPPVFAANDCSSRTLAEWRSSLKSDYDAYFRLTLDDPNKHALFVPVARDDDCIK